jgi:hypothetical protein
MAHDRWSRIVNVDMIIQPLSPQTWKPADMPTLR